MNRLLRTKIEAMTHSETAAPIPARAKAAGLKVVEVDGVSAVMFPKALSKNGKGVPLLMSEDGRLWSPEFEIENEPTWVGKMDLAGANLVREIERMGAGLKVDVSAMVEFVRG